VVALPAVASLHAGKSPPGVLDHAPSGAVVQLLQSSASSAVFIPASAQEGLYTGMGYKSSRCQVVAGWLCCASLKASELLFSSFIYTPCTECFFLTRNALHSMLLLVMNYSGVVFLEQIIVVSCLTGVHCCLLLII